MIMMNWSHPSLEPRRVYETKGNLILKGRMVIGMVRGRKVFAMPSGEEIGRYQSPAQAMMMAARYHEAE
jgi:hypothetical protein